MPLNDEVSSKDPDSWKSSPSLGLRCRIGSSGFDVLTSGMLVTTIRALGHSVGAVAARLVRLWGLVFQAYVRRQMGHGREKA